MIARKQTVAAAVAMLTLLAVLPAAGVAGAAGVQDDDTTTNASTGQQLSTVIEVTDEEVRHEVEVEAIEAEFDAENEADRAAAIAKRAAELQNRSAAIHDEYQTATQAYEDGELSRSGYAQRLAVLHARANAVQTGFDRVERAANDTSSLELESAGYDPAAVAQAREQLRSVSGSGVGALLAQFTGVERGEFSVETDGGLSIEVESDDGERSREYERDAPEHGTFDLSWEDARDRAEGELSAPGDDGGWVLQSVGRDDDGYYEFEFVYAGNQTTGEAEVSVDARSGSVFALDEELEPVDAPDDELEEDDRDDDDAENESEDEAEDDDSEDETEDDDSEDETEDDDSEDEAEDDDSEDEADDDADEDDDSETSARDELLAIHVVEGDLAPGATVTLQVTDVAGSPVSDAGVRVDYEEVGRTDANGELAVTIPEKDDVAFDAEAGEAEGELDVEFAERDAEAERIAKLDVGGQVADGTATLRASYDGEAVADATVLVEGERVGATDASGEVQFAAPADREFDAEIARGEFHVETELAVENGEIVVTESEFGDGLDEEVENETEDDAESDGDATLNVSVVEGEPAAGATVTIAVANGDDEPVADATVEVEGDVVGTTDAAGEIEVTLPDAEDAEIEAEHDHASGELELAFGGDGSDDSDEETDD